MKLKVFTLIALNLLVFYGASGKEKIKNQTPNVFPEIQQLFPFQTQHCHGSTVVELPNGDLLAAWFQGSGERTSDDVAIKGSRYNHRLKKWGEPFVMADVPDFPDINPVLFIDNQSRLWLTWYTVLAYQWSTSLLKYRISENYQQKEGAPEWGWQDVIHVKPDGQPVSGINEKDTFVSTLSKKFEDYAEYLKQSGRFNNKNGITQERFEMYRNFYLDIAKGKNLLADGTETGENGETVKSILGYPLMRRIGWQTRNKPLFLGNRMLLPLYSDGLNLSLMAITENGGKTWQFSEPILGGGAIQPTLAENKDGSITILMRDNGPAPKRLQKSVSKDGGFTWSTVEDTEIPNPGTAADVVVLASGNWALVLNDLEEGRHKLSVWLSEDVGKTWPFRKTLVNGESGSAVRGHYPAIIQGKNGIIHITYTNQVAGSNGGPDVKNIVHAAFSEGWLKK